MTEKESGIKRRFNGSLEPPLGFNSLLQLQRTSSDETARSLVAQSSTDSEPVVVEDDVILMAESTTTLVSSVEDQDPLKSSCKRRFESGTSTSNPGLILIHFLNNQ